MFRFVSIVVLAASAVSCTKVLGWGVLLWSSEDPAIPSGTLLPVYIKSNINQTWIAGIPDIYRSADEGSADKFELPLEHLTLVGSRSAAQKQAEAFMPFAVMYAETLQDGLPVRDGTDNSARRVYRLKLGEIVKILEKVEGTPALSTTGEPLPGDWYQVLTRDGNAGYCFSYRLRLFEYSGGTPLVQARAVEEAVVDTELDAVLAKVWTPELYDTMIASGKVDVDMLAQGWGFFPGQDSGKARIFVKDSVDSNVILDKAFSYTSIQSAGTRSWRFEGASLQMALRSDTVLAVQYTENGSALRTLLFTELPSSVDDLIVEENARRNSLYRRIYSQGPVFSSTNYGTLSLNANGSFTWQGFDMLTPQIVPSSAQGSGKAVMGLFLDSSLASRYAGAFYLQFNGVREPVSFLYNLDNQGFRIEYVAQSSIEGVTVMRRAASPTVIYFFNGGADYDEDDEF
jgi:hypothetical protein